MSVGVEAGIEFRAKNILPVLRFSFCVMTRNLTRFATAGQCQGVITQQKQGNRTSVKERKEKVTINRGQNVNH